MLGPGRAEGVRTNYTTYRYRPCVTRLSWSAFAGNPSVFFTRAWSSPAWPCVPPCSLSPAPAHSQQRQSVRHEAYSETRCKISLFWVVGNSHSVIPGALPGPRAWGNVLRSCALSGQLETCVHTVTADTLLIQVHGTLQAGDFWGSHMGAGHSFSRCVIRCPP